MRIHEISVNCWCERQIMRVPRDVFSRGETLSCGRRGCGQAEAVPSTPVTRAQLGCALGVPRAIAPSTTAPPPLPLSLAERIPLGDGQWIQLNIDADLAKSERDTAWLDQVLSTWSALRECVLARSVPVTKDPQ